VPTRSAEVPIAVPEDGKSPKPAPARAAPFLDCALLLAATGISRYLCRSHFLYDIDSVNFALAMDHFDPALHQPHPPGYFLYVCAARAANLIFHDANTSLVALSILASCAAAVLIYLLTRTWFGRPAGIFAGAIFIFSPLCWFHGTVALTYIVEAFFSAMIGYLCWRGDSGERSWLWGAAVALGVASGFRPSSLLFLGPLFLFSLRAARVHIRVLAISLLTLTLLAWWIPMTEACGGMRAYFGSLLALWNHIPAKQNLRTAFPAMVVARSITILGIGALCFGCTLFLSLTREARTDRARHTQKIFTYVWVSPGLLFFTFVFLNFVNSGYILVLTPPLFAWLGLRVSVWYTRNSSRKLFRNSAITLVALANACIFFCAPVYCSLREVKRFEAQLTLTVAELRQRYAPEKTLIVGFDSHFLGYRHAGYYLPEFLTVQYPAVPLPGGKRIFAVEHRRTELLVAVPASRFRQFVFFPLPSGSDYRGYMDRVLALLPANAVRSEGRDPRFLAGYPVDLAGLFSGAVRP